MLLLSTLGTHLVLANNVETKNTISYSVEHASQKEVHVAGVLRVLDKR